MNPQSPTVEQRSTIPTAPSWYCAAEHSMEGPKSNGEPSGPVSAYSSPRVVHPNLRQKKYRVSKISLMTGPEHHTLAMSNYNSGVGSSMTSGGCLSGVPHKVCQTECAPGMRYRQSRRKNKSLLLRIQIRAAQSSQSLQDGRVFDTTVSGINRCACSCIRSWHQRTGRYID